MKIGEIVRDWIFNVISCGTAPVAGFTTQDTICLGQVSSFTNTSSGDSAYYWNFGVPVSTIDTSTFSSPSYTYSAPGNYAVYFIINPGQGFCTDTAFDTVTVQICIGMDELTEPQMTLFPNPAGNELFFFLDDVRPGDLQVVLTDMTGKAIRTEKYFCNSNVFEAKMNLNDIAPGVYFVSLLSETTMLMSKILIE